MKKIIGGIIILGFIAAALWHCLSTPDPENEPLKKADPLAADMILVNLAIAMRTHSAMTGGGGHAKFANDLSQITHLSNNKIKGALPGLNQTSFDGYIVRLEENPKGDNFATNFLLIAYPANGYEGDVFTIDKTEKVKKLEIE